MLNNHSRGQLQSCCCTKQLSMALLHVSHYPAQTGGGEDILYIFFQYFLDTKFWTSLQIFIWAPPPILPAPCYRKTFVFI